MTLLTLFSCFPQEELDQTCDGICDELVRVCEYGAYPSIDSCLQGCAYKAEQGASLDRLDTCIARADCDTFAIIECEHAPGIGAE